MKNNCSNKFEITKVNNGIKINIRVIPNASKCELAGIIEKNLKIKLDTPPVDGKANEKCIKFISNLLDVSKSSVSITSGKKSKSKVLFIRGNAKELEARLLGLILG